MGVPLQLIVFSYLRWRHVQPDLVHIYLWFSWIILLYIRCFLSIGRGNWFLSGLLLITKSRCYQFTKSWLHARARYLLECSCLSFHSSVHSIPVRQMEKWKKKKKRKQTNKYRMKHRVNHIKLVAILLKLKRYFALCEYVSLRFCISCMRLCVCVCMYVFTLLGFFLFNLNDGAVL